MKHKAADNAIKKFIIIFETSLKTGINGWAWPIVTLIAGLEIDIVIHIIIWLISLKLSIITSPLTCIYK